MHHTDRTKRIRKVISSIKRLLRVAREKAPTISASGTSQRRPIIGGVVEVVQDEDGIEYRRYSGADIDTIHKCISNLEALRNSAAEDTDDEYYTLDETLVSNASAAINEVYVSLGLEDFEEDEGT
jgi:hypothetical protein